MEILASIALIVLLALFFDNGYFLQKRTEIRLFRWAYWGINTVLAVFLIIVAVGLLRNAF